MPTLMDILGDVRFPKLKGKDRFYEELGRFISACASAEQAVHIVFSETIRIALWKSKALTGGLKLATMTTLLRNIAEKGIKSEAKRKELDKLLTHLDAIAKLRNALVHRSVDFSETEFTASDFHTAKSMESAVELRFQLEHLEQATADLSRIKMRLYMIRRLHKGLVPLSRKERKYLFAPWRYKPLAQQKLWNRLLADALMRRSRPPTLPA